MTEPPDAIAFPDGQPYRVGAVRAAYVLIRRSGGAIGGDGWDGIKGLTAARVGTGLRVQVDEFLCFLKHEPAAERYVGGGWPNEVATAFVVTRAPTGLLLEIRDAERVGCWWAGSVQPPPPPP